MATVRGGIRARQVAVVPPKTGIMPAGHMRVKLETVVLAVVAMVAPSTVAEEERPKETQTDDYEWRGREHARNAPSRQ